MNKSACCFCLLSFFLTMLCFIRSWIPRPAEIRRNIIVWCAWIYLSYQTRLLTTYLLLSIVYITTTSDFNSFLYEEIYMFTFIHNRLWFFTKSIWWKPINKLEYARRAKSDVWRLFLAKSGHFCRHS